MSRDELIEKLRNTEETLLLELLEITSTELVDAFLDKIEDRIDYIYEQIDEKET